MLTGGAIEAIQGNASDGVHSRLDRRRLGEL